MDTLPSPSLIHWTEIERIQTRGSAAGTGAKIGAVVCCVLAIGIGVAVQSDSFLGGNAGGVMAGVGGGTLFGAGVGALIGLATPRWVNVHVGRPAK